MADYTRYRTETLEKMRDAAWEKYLAETGKPGAGWGSGSRRRGPQGVRGFDRAKTRYDAICAELRRREAAG